jgi:hypothetical protein
VSTIVVSAALASGISIRRSDLPLSRRGVESGLPTPADDEVRDRQYSCGADDRGGCNPRPFLAPDLAFRWLP